MATANSYGAKFIGNDFVAPRVTQRITRPVYTPQRRYVAEPAYEPVPVAEPYYEPAPVMDEAFGTQLAPVRQARRMPQLPRLPHLLTLRTGIIALSAAVVIAGAIIAVPRSAGTWHAAHSVASKVALGASDSMHHKTQGSSFVMPAHAQLVKNSVLTTFEDAVESQPITVNAGNVLVTPSPSDIGKWFTTSAGPDAGTTLVRVNTANISAYLNGIVERHAVQLRTTGSYSPSIATNAANQLAAVLLKYNGATVTLTAS